MAALTFPLRGAAIPIRRTCWLLDLPWRTMWHSQKVADRTSSGERGNSRAVMDKFFLFLGAMVKP
ncbi:MAG: hypothetical protein ACOYNN_05195 [Terrimicrobiaceae bacterium]